MAPGIPTALVQRYAAAHQAFQAGAVMQARGMLEALLQADPRFAPARQLLGVCLAQMGDLAGAERELRQAVSLDKRQPALHADLGELLAETGRPAEAERAYRAALQLDRRHVPAAHGLSRLLIQQGRAGEAVQVTLPLAAASNAAPAALEAHTKALFGAGRLEEALTSSRRATAAGVPDAAVGTGQILGELSRHAEAEVVFRDILARAPNDERARRGLARAIFAQTGDADAAGQPLDHLRSPALAAYKAKLLSHADRSPEAYALLREALRGRPDDVTLHAAAATAAALAGEADGAHAHAERALALAPGADEIQVLVAEACLGVGRPQRALEIALALRRTRPFDQKLISLQATALRLLGDERYHRLHDYDRFVRAYELEPPRGWATLEAFLSDLRARLNVIHDGMSEPLDQSFRGGTQTHSNLIFTDEPLIIALFMALDRSIADFAASLDRSDDAFADPFLARGGGGHAYSGAWSIRLKPGGGRHVNHIHGGGWISSAFYVELPAVMAAAERGHEGWIQFGEPGTPTRPALPAEHFVKPQAGRLVLFPSYMWHGTVPFGGDERRMTFAFDVVPAGESGRPTRASSLGGRPRGC